MLLDERTTTIFWLCTGWFFTARQQVLSYQFHPTLGAIGMELREIRPPKDGTVVGRFKSKVAPDSPELVSAIERELRK